MTKYWLSLTAAFLGFVLVPAYPQLGPASGGAKGSVFGATVIKLFGDHTAFSAKVEMEATPPDGTEPMIIPGTVRFLDGKTRFEMDMTQARGGRVPSGMGEQLKVLGMGEMVIITRPEKNRKAFYMVYPGLSAYAEQPLPEAEGEGAATTMKMETTELGKETLEAHPCVKCKVVVTDAKGKAHDYTVWYATDLKRFPIRMRITAGAQPATLTLREVKFEKPLASLFDPPQDYTRHTNVQAMLMQGVMKAMGGAGPKEGGQ
jgi:hypothetical protein